MSLATYLNVFEVLLGNLSCFLKSHVRFIVNRKCAFFILNFLLTGLACTFFAVFCLNTSNLALFLVEHLAPFELRFLFVLNVLH